MMHTTQFPASLSAGGEQLDLSKETFGPLLDSSDLLSEAPLLRERMERDGYLFFSGLLNRDEVLEARRAMVGKLAATNQLLPGTDPMECVALPRHPIEFIPDIAMQTPQLLSVLYGNTMMGFWDSFFGEPARHFDFTWFRAVTPGRATPPHTDAVYMNRGTQKLFTCWTPIGDVPLEMGPLMVLEGSHQHQKLREGYSSRDVDALCTNTRVSRTNRANNLRANAGGMLSIRPAKLREAIGGRWLSADFQAGDILIFSIYTVHCSLDNTTDRIRMTSDSRYQRASEPADERWIRINDRIAAHGPDAKRAMIC